MALATAASALLVLLLSLLSAFPPTFAQCPVCNATTDAPPNCNVTSTNTSLVFSCTPNITGCGLQTCASNQGCSFDYLHFAGIWTFHSACANFCSILDSCTISHSGDRFDILCCCNRKNCTDVTVSGLRLPTAANAMPTTARNSGNTSTIPPSSSGLVITIAMVTVGALVAILAIVGIIIICFCFKRAFRAPTVTRRSSVVKQYSSRYSQQPWVLQGMLGQGRFSQVYKALYNGEVVAVKVYSSHSQSRTTWETERNLFSMESIQHRNIIEFVMSDSREAGGVANTSPLQLHIVTRYYPLGSLTGYLCTHVLSWKQACCLVRCIASGLKHIHSENWTNQAGIVTEKYPIAHRDIKSANILLVDEDGECVIADFGFALQLMPTANPNELSNQGQIGTARYMSPELLEARMNLRDLQSFKQVDIYAFSLVMWEIMTRCCVLSDEDVGEYIQPYGDIVTHPTLSSMKDIVCTRQLRPSIPPLWSNHEPLTTYTDMVRECWDNDPDARLTAGNILYQIQDLYNSSPQILQEHTLNHTPSSSQNHTHNNQSSRPADLGHILFQEHSQSSPPPCYSPTDPVPFSVAQNQENRARGHGTNRNHFRTSMPHILPTGDSEQQCSNEVAMAALTPGCTWSLSRMRAQQNGQGQYRPTQSVRNSLVLGERIQLHDDPLPTFSDVCNEDSLSSSHSVDDIGMGHVQVSESDTSLVPELDMPQNADSGIHSDSSHSVARLRSSFASSTDTRDSADTVEMRITKDVSGASVTAEDAVG